MSWGNKLFCVLTVFLLLSCKHSQVSELRSQLTSADIKQLTIKNSKVLFKIDKDGLKHWSSPGYKYETLEKGKIESLLKLIAENLDREQVFSAQEELSQYGINKNNDYIEFTSNNGSRSKLLVGDFSEYYQKFFVWLENYKLLFLFDKKLVELIRQDITYFQTVPVYSTLINTDLINVHRLQFINAENNKRVIQQNSKKEWLVNGRPGDAIFIDQLLQNLFTTNARLADNKLLFEELAMQKQVASLPELTIIVESAIGQILDELEIWHLRVPNIYLVETRSGLAQMAPSWYRRIYPNLEVLLATSNDMRE